MDATTSTSSVLRSGHASSPSAKSTCSTDSRSLSYLILDGDLASPSQASRNLYQSHRPCSPSSVSRSESVIIHDQDVGISVAHYLPNDFVTPPTTPVQKRTKPTPPHDHHSTDRPSQGHYVLSPSLKTPKYRIRKKYDPHNANERSFIQAGWEGDVAKIQLLITDGTDIACTDKYGWTAFHRAARYNHVKLCEYFLDEGMDVDITTDDNSSALQLVSLRNHIEVATCLLER